MKKVVFYLIDKPLNIENELSHYEHLACLLILNLWKSAKRTLVFCETKNQAEKIDEFLWRIDPSRFIPHNLIGEGLTGGSPVEIAWLEKKSAVHRRLLINLSDNCPDFSVFYNEIIDFVPADEKSKILARKRYMDYKVKGFNLKTIKLSECIVENSLNFEINL